MNPSEGGLRPQLLDRFGLMVEVVTEREESKRSQILKNVLLYESERFGGSKPVSNLAREKDRQIASKLLKAREHFKSQVVGDKFASVCAKVAQAFDTEGHRADYIMALAAMAHASLMSRKSPTAADVLRVARFALQHRQRGGSLTWNEERVLKVKEELKISTT
jgi:magnesium chelatase subunit I